MPKQSNPKVSVIIPCYNQGKYLEETVNSVLSQTYQSFEIIIVNDGSDDELTKKVLKTFKKPKTRIYNTRNRGVSAARNYGFSLAKGQYIQFLDADDFIESTKFEKQLEVFHQNKDIDVCYTNYMYFIEDIESYIVSNFPLILTNRPLDDFLYRWQRSLSIPIHCALFRRNCWEKGNPFLEGYGVCEDWIMWIRLAEKGLKFFYLDEILAYYRIHQKSTTKNKSFSIYWLSRTISYIADNIIAKDEQEKFNEESQKYMNMVIEDMYLAERDQEIKEKQQYIDEILNSKFWRFSKPLRKLFSNLDK